MEPDFVLYQLSRIQNVISDLQSIENISSLKAFDIFVHAIEIISEYNYSGRFKGYIEKTERGNMKKLQGVLITDLLFIKNHSVYPAFISAKAMEYSLSNVPSVKNSKVVMSLEK